MCICVLAWMYVCVFVGVKQGKGAQFQLTHGCGCGFGVTQRGEEGTAADSERRGDFETSGHSEPDPRDC